MSQHQNFLNSVIQKLGIRRSPKKTSTPESVINLCIELISNNGETTLFSLAQAILDNFNTLTEQEKKIIFFPVA